MKVTSKRYVVSTSALNCYGYRVLTSGVDLTQYLKNPVLFWMHKRDTSGNMYDKLLPLGRAVDVRKEGDQITCGLSFSESNAFAMKVYEMYEDGTLNMLSLGAEPLQLSTAITDQVPGQTGPTVILCKAVEFSCVDIGGNDEALAVELYNQEGKIISLSLANASNISTIHQQYTPNQFNSPYNAQIAMSAIPDKPATPAVNHNEETLAIVKNAVAAGKFTQQQADDLLKSGSDEQSVKNILQKVKEAKIDPERLKGKVPAVILPLVTKTWSELNTGWGEINKLKEHAWEVYSAKYFEKYGRLALSMDEYRTKYGKK